MRKTEVIDRKIISGTTPKSKLAFMPGANKKKPIDIYVHTTDDKILIGVIHKSNLLKEYTFTPLEGLFLQFTEEALGALHDVINAANNNL